MLHIYYQAKFMILVWFFFHFFFHRGVMFVGLVFFPGFLHRKKNPNAGKKLRQSEFVTFKRLIKKIPKN